MTGHELKALRRALGLTQRRLAELVGVSWTTIGRYEQPHGSRVYPVPHWLAREVERMVKDAAHCPVKLCAAHERLRTRVRKPEE